MCVCEREREREREREILDNQKSFAFLSSVMSKKRFLQSRRDKNDKKLFSLIAKLKRENKRERSLKRVSRNSLPDQLQVKYFAAAAISCFKGLEIE